MGQGFSSNQLAGAATSELPITSYAYDAANTARFGIDAYYDGYGGEGHLVAGTVTPYLVPPSGPTATCEPILAGESTSIACPTMGADMEPGLYTLSFSQYQQYPVWNPVMGFQSFSTPDDAVFTAVNLDLTFSVVKPFVVTTLTTTLTLPPSTTVEATTTSGFAESPATFTATVPKSTITVTVFSTTVVSTSTSLSTFLTATIATVTQTCGSTSATGPVLIAPKGCKQDNCLRAMLNRPAQNSPFCSTYKTKAIPTPAYLSVCLDNAKAVTSACSCFAKATTKAPSKPVAARLVAQIVYGPPDFTYSPVDDVISTVYSSDSTATTTVPSTTMTDPDSTISSGTSTFTSSVATTTITVFKSTTSSTSLASTVTITPAACLGD